MARQSVLIVDDLPEKLEFLQAVVNATFDMNSWEVVPCRSKEEAEAEIQRRGRDFAVGLIDLYLTEPEQNPGEGLGVAKALRQANPNAYVILVSRIIDDRGKLRGESSSIDEFVYLRFTPRSNPWSALQDALHRAEQPILQAR